MGDVDPRHPRRPNIVLVYTDEHRFDALGAAGNTVIKTPHLDRLAADGVRFSRMYCQAPLCQPSRASFITGLHVHQHGLVWNRMTMDPNWPTMMKRLQQVGYATAKFGKYHFGTSKFSQTRDRREKEGWLRAFGFDVVFEEFDRHVHLIPKVKTHYTEYLNAKGLLAQYRAELDDGFGFWHPRVSKLPQVDQATSYVADRAIDWLRNYEKDNPFFLWVSIAQPHPPFLDQETWAEEYKDAQIPLGPTDPIQFDPATPYGRYLSAWYERLRRSGGHMAGKRDGARGRGTDVEEAARHYYGMVSLIDQKVGDIREAVESLGRGDDTWFIFTADHGEMLGDHSLLGKNVFYRGSVLVPCIIRPPRGMEGRVVDAPTQSIDATATIIDLADAKPIEGSFGRSLSPLMAGEGSPRQVAFSELGGHMGRDNFFVMVATERYRFLYDSENDFSCELFDLQEDPDELQNLVEDPEYRTVRDDLYDNYVVPFLAGKTG